MRILLPDTGSGPGVVVAHAWWGLNATIIAYGEALAAAGFVVALPDVFDGRVAVSIEEAQALADTAWSPDATTVYVDAVRKLAEHPAVTSPRIGMVAFSYGGYFALGLAGHPNLPLGGIATYYATRDLPETHVPVLAHFATSDAFESGESMEELATHLTARGEPGGAHFYPGTSHWFAEADRIEHVPEAAALALDRTVQFLRAVTA